MKKILSLFVLAGALFASVGCDDKPKSSSTPAKAPAAGDGKTPAAGDPAKK